MGTCGKSIFQMFFKGIVFVGHAGNTALCHFGIAIIDRSFGDDCDGTGGLFCKHQCRGKSCQPAADHQMVIINFFGRDHIFSTTFCCNFL